MIGELPPQTTKATVFLDLDNVVPKIFSEKDARSHLIHLATESDAVVDAAFEELPTVQERRVRENFRFKSAVLTRLARWCDNSFDLDSQNRLAYANLETTRDSPLKTFVEHLDWHFTVTPNHKEEVDHRIERDLASRLNGTFNATCVVVISQDMKLHRRVEKISRDVGRAAHMGVVTIFDSSSVPGETLQHWLRDGTPLGSLYDFAITIVEALRNDFHDEKASEDLIGTDAFAAYRSSLTTASRKGNKARVGKRRGAIEKRILLSGTEVIDYVRASLDQHMSRFESLRIEALALNHAVTLIEQGSERGELQIPPSRIQNLRTAIVREFDSRRDSFGGPGTTAASRPIL